jgi:hypothetical protein
MLWEADSAKENCDATLLFQDEELFVEVLGEQTIKGSAYLCSNWEIDFSEKSDGAWVELRRDLCGIEFAFTVVRDAHSWSGVRYEMGLNRWRERGACSPISIQIERRLRREIQSDDCRRLSRECEQWGRWKAGHGSGQRRQERLEGWQRHLIVNLTNEMKDFPLHRQLLSIVFVGGVELEFIRHRVEDMDRPQEKQRPHTHQLFSGQGKVAMELFCDPKSLKETIFGGGEVPQRAQDSND